MHPLGILTDGVEFFQSLLTDSFWQTPNQQDLVAYSV